MNLYIRWGGVPGGLQDRSNSVSQVDGVLNMAPACQLSLDVFFFFFKFVVVRLPFNLIVDG